MKKRRTIYVTDEELNCLKAFLNLLRTEQLPCSIRITTSDARTIDIASRKTEVAL